MHCIVTAESKSFFNYGNRTEKIFRPTQPWTFRGAGNQKNLDWDFQRCGRGFGIAGINVSDVLDVLQYKHGQFDNKTQDLSNIPCSAAHIRLCPLWNKIMQLMVFFIRLPVAKSKNESCPCRKRQNGGRISQNVSYSPCSGTDFCEEGVPKFLP